MRRAILTLAVLLGACDTQEQDLLPSADRDLECREAEAAPLDANDAMDAIVACLKAGGTMATSTVGDCWVWHGGVPDCHMPQDEWYGCGDGGEDAVCASVSSDVWCAAGKAMLCEAEGGHNCETANAINDRAEATMDALCGQ